VRVDFGYDGGGIGKGGAVRLLTDQKLVGEGRVDKSVIARFSLDETFDIGEDTGTPVVEDYVDKMPFPFTGTLKKVLIVLEPEKLTDEEKKRLREEAARAGMTVH